MALVWSCALDVFVWSIALDLTNKYKTRLINILRKIDAETAMGDNI